MRTHPKIDTEAVLANPNMTLYELDTLVTRVLGGFVSSMDIGMGCSAQSDFGSCMAGLYRTLLPNAIGQELHLRNQSPVPIPQFP